MTKENTSDNIFSIQFYIIFTAITSITGLILYFLDIGDVGIFFLINLILMVYTWFQFYVLMDKLKGVERDD